MTAKRILILLVSLGFLASCEEQPETPPPYQFFSIEQMKTAAELRQAALGGSGSYDILEELVTVAPKRLAGSPGDAVARDWAVAKLNALGFDKVWVQEFTMRGWERISAAALITSPYIERLDITSLGKSVSTPEGGVTAEVIHFNTFEDLQAADDADVVGKIVFISNKMERAIDGSGYRPAVIARARGHAEVAKKGGLALIIRSIGTDDHDAPHTGAMSFNADGIATAFRAPTDGDPYSIAYGERTAPAAAISNVDADALQALFEAGESVTMTVDIQNNDMGDITSYNIIGEITGSERPDEIVITGGHIDAWDTGIGAMDDGMGIAITMEAAAMIAALPARPKRTIRYVAFGAEELGLVGAFAYAEEYGADDHVFGIESDFGIGKVWQLTPTISPDAIPVLREIWRLMGPMGVGWDPEATGFPGPDLIPLVNAGMAGASLNGDGTRYFDLHHTAHDQLSEIAAEDLDYNTAAYAALLYLVAEYDGRFDNPLPEEISEEENQ